MSCIIEQHLPGDFSDWEEKHSNWEGDIKTVKTKANDPRAGSCAWSLFIASTIGADYFGLPKKANDLQALRKLKQALQQARDALANLSMLAAIELTIAENDPQPTIGGGKAKLGLKLAITDTLASIPHAVEVMESKGVENYRHNVKAVAVVAECRKVWQARKGVPAPKSARDRGQKSSDGNKPAPFAQFSQDVFRALGINSRVSGALDALSCIQELAEKSGKTPE